MSEHQCNCGGSTDDWPADREVTDGRWIDGPSVLRTSLPADVSRNMGRFLDEPVETLSDFVAAARAGTGGGPLAVDDLCHTDAPTDHTARVNGDTYSFSCFFDGIALAALVDASVEVHTTTPTGASIDLVATPAGEVTVTPPDAVMSFGIATDDRPPGERGQPVDVAVVEAMCPYVRAFTSRDRYEGWAAGVDAATVGMPLAAGVEIAAALTDGA